MQKALRATAVALSLSLVSLAASATSGAGFLRFEGGQARYDVDHTPYDGKPSRALGIGGGYRWQVSTPFALGLEVGYMDMGKVREGVDGAVFLPNGVRKNVRFRSEFGARAFLLGTNGRWQLADTWSLTGRFGMAHMRTRLAATMEVEGTSNSFRARAVNNTAYAGLGVNYALSPKIDLGFNVTHYSATGSGFAVNELENVNVFGLSAEVRL
jgi:opacity protein-like surface antigen